MHAILRFNVFIFALFFCAFLAHSPAPASAQQIRPMPDVNSQYQEAVTQSRALLAALMDEGNIPGLSIAVAVEGQIVWAEGFGFADLEQGVQITPETKMRIGSVSKSLTSAAIGVLYEQGKLDLDAPVQTYASYFPEKAHPISTRQVAGHIAGIRHYRSGEMMSARFYPTVNEGIGIFIDDPLLFEPGTDYSYSSYGWNLISAIVEGASDEEFLPFMRKHVFDPIGMNNTVAERMDLLIADRTRYYVRDDNGDIKNAPYVDNSYKWAGGGFISTPSDVVRFGHAMHEASLLSQETVDVLFEPMTLSNGESTSYGIGWSSGTDSEGRPWVGHSGGSVGGTTQFKIYPTTGVIVCVVSNLSSTRYEQADLTVAGYFMDAKLAR